MRAGLKNIDKSRFDVCVLGAGINGAATAALLAEKGHSVLLIDRNDFGSGTSSRSSRLLHCGLSQIGGVRDARGLKEALGSLAAARLMMRERARLVKRMPERLRPATFFIPLFKAGPASPWQLRTAFWLLSVLGAFEVPLEFSHYSRKEIRSNPLLARLGPDVVGAVSFREYVFDWPERMCIDYVSRAEALGSVAINYSRLVASQVVPEGWDLTISDCHDAGSTAEVGARVVLNMCGPWSDLMNAQLISDPPRTLTFTKGCHVAVKLPSEFEGKGIVTTSEGGHMFICTPWRDFHILGPTEQVYEGDPADVEVCDEDVELILRRANTLFPSLQITPSNVMWKYAGVRPVTFEEGKLKGIWQKRIYDLTSRAGSPLLSVSWGRVVDHFDTAARLSGLVESRLKKNKTGAAANGAASNITFSAEGLSNTGARTIADLLFRRSGRGWDSDLGLEDAGQAARSLAGGDERLEESLCRDYVQMLEEKFGYVKSLKTGLECTTRG